MIQKYKISNKYKHFKEVDKIFRYRGIVKTRHGKLRFDANERVSDFDKTFLNKIKKKINSNYLTAYPETEKIYDSLTNIFIESSAQNKPTNIISDYLAEKIINEHKKNKTVV